MYWSEIRHYHDGRLSVFKNNNWNNALLASVLLKRADRPGAPAAGDADTEPVMIIIGPGRWSESGEGPYCVL
jgi:hypothetical protein